MGYTFGVTEFGAAASVRRSPRGELALKIFLEFFHKKLDGFWGLQNSSYKILCGRFADFSGSDRLLPPHKQISRFAGRI